MYVTEWVLKMFKEILQYAQQTYQFPFTLPPANMGKTYRESTNSADSICPKICTIRGVPAKRVF